MAGRVTLGKVRGVGRGRPDKEGVESEQFFPHATSMRHLGDFVEAG
jgi:hypothetical protein